jgi:hypothetical protein
MSAGMGDPGGSLDAEWNNLNAENGTQMGRADDIVRGVSSVWVLLSNFGNPRASSIGVYIMKGDEKQRIETFFTLAFERYEHAEQYACLASTSESRLTPVEWPAEQLRAFCYNEGFEVAFARQFVIPSSINEQYEYDLQSKVVRGTQSRVSDGISANLYSHDAMNSGPHGFGRSAINSPMEAPMQQPRGPEGMSAIWVVIINPGRDNEGVYTLQDMERRRQDQILIFESRFDAKEFADKLKGFDVVAPMQWDPMRLRDFCQQGGFETELIPEGRSMHPPEVNEYDVEAFSMQGGAPNVEAHDEQSLPLHRRLHLQNLRVLLEDRMRRSMGDEFGDQWQP